MLLQKRKEDAQEDFHFQFMPLMKEKRRKSQLMKKRKKSLLNLKPVLLVGFGLLLVIFHSVSKTSLFITTSQKWLMLQISLINGLMQLSLTSLMKKTSLSNLSLMKKL
jgi:hypothetical protein